MRSTLGLIKNYLVENTDECFYAGIESDSQGAHFTLYLIENTIDLIVLRRFLLTLKSKKKFVILFSTSDRIKYLNNTAPNIM